MVFWANTPAVNSNRTQRAFGTSVGTKKKKKPNTQSGPADVSKTHQLSGRRKLRLLEPPRGRDQGGLPVPLRIIKRGKCNEPKVVLCCRGEARKFLFIEQPVLGNVRGTIRCS